VTDQAERPEEERELTEAEQIAGARRELANALRACTAKERLLIRALPEHRYQPWRAGLKIGLGRKAIQLMVRRARFQRARVALEALGVLETCVTQRMVLEELVTLGKARLKDFYNDDNTLKKPSEWPDEWAGAVQEYYFDDNGDPRIKLHDKKGALDALAKFLRMMPDRLELTGRDGEALNPPAPVLNVIIANKPEPTPTEGAK
jgi:hypothetical protein